MNPSNNSQTAGTSASATNQVPATTIPGLDPLSATNPLTPGTAQTSAAQAPQIMPMNPIPLLPLPVAGVPAGLQATTVVNPVVGLQVAEDKDIIEPEWVNKAKSIVRNTNDDPYKQSEDLTMLKADYMQKRYNKIVKLK